MGEWPLQHLLEYSYEAESTGDLCSSAIVWLSARTCVRACMYAEAAVAQANMSVSS